MNTKKIFLIASFCSIFLLNISSALAFSGLLHYCPGAATFKYNKLLKSYKVPSDWCWAPNVGSTTKCLTHIKKSNIAFNGAVYTTTLGGRLAGRMLCSYTPKSSYILYSKTKLNNNPPNLGKWKCLGIQQVNRVCSGFGWYCTSSNRFDCPF